MNTQLNEDSKVGEIYRTFDYDRFTLLDGNRIIKEGHAKRIEDSMRKEYILNPIIINEKYQIIDGQHRFCAMRSLKIPIDYILVNGLGLSDCQRLNINSKNWTTKDFIESYANQGNDYYIKFNKFINEFEFISSVQTAAYLLQNSKNNKFEGFMLGHIKSGEFVFSEEQYKKAIDVANMIEDFKSISDIYKDDKFQRAFMEIVKVESYNHERMLSKCDSLEHKFTKQLKISLYYDILTEIYNYKIKKEDRLFFNIICG